MAIAYAEALRNARLDQVTTRAGNAAKLRIYSGTRPATGGTATTLLAELTCGSPFAPAASAGTLTANAVTQDSSADSTGTATWFRIVQSDGTTHVLDGDVGTSGSDLNLTSVSIVAGGTVSVTSFVLTGGNA
jgi:hypothetical protein